MSGSVSSVPVHSQPTDAAAWSWLPEKERGYVAKVIVDMAERLAPLTPAQAEEEAKQHRSWSTAWRNAFDGCTLSGGTKLIDHPESIVDFIVRTAVFRRTIDPWATGNVGWQPRLIKSLVPEWATTFPREPAGIAYVTPVVQNFFGRLDGSSSSQRSNRRDRSALRAARSEFVCREEARLRKEVADREEAAAERERIERSEQRKEVALREEAAAERERIERSEQRNLDHQLQIAQMQMQHLERAWERKELAAERKFQRETEAAQRAEEALRRKREREENQLFVVLTPWGWQSVPWWWLQSMQAPNMMPPHMFMEPNVQNASSYWNQPAGGVGLVNKEEQDFREERSDSIITSSEDSVASSESMTSEFASSESMSSEFASSESMSSEFSSSSDY